MNDLQSKDAELARENARLQGEIQHLQRETEHRAAELAVINSVQNALAAELDMQGIYDAVGDKLREIFQRADIGIRIYDEKSDTIHVPYLYEGGQRIHIEPHPLSRTGVTVHVFTTRQPLVINENVQAETAKLGSVTFPGTEQEKSVVYVPLLWGDRARGLISLADMKREHAFSPSDVRLLQTLAGTVSAALQNASLFEEIQRRTRPAVAWNGDEYLVVWEEYDSVIKNSQIFGVRIDTDGVLLDATPIAIVPGNDPAVAASGTDFLVVSTHEPINHYREVLGVRIDTNGVVLDATPLTVGDTYALDPDVTGTNSGWVVAWEHQGTHDSPTASIYASSVDTAGVVTAELTVARDGGSDQRDPSVASDGTKALFAWSGDGNVRGRRMNAAGTMLGNAAGFVINQKNNEQFGTSVAWTGARYQAAWTDWRIHDLLEPGEGDVYTTTVTTLGVVKNKAGLAVSADPDVPEGNVAVGGANGAAVFAWTKMHDEAPYGGFRIETAFYRELPAPMMGAAGDGEVPAMHEGGEAGGCNTAPGAGLLAGLLSLLGLRRRRGANTHSSVGVFAHRQDWTAALASHRAVITARYNANSVLPTTMARRLPSITKNVVEMLVSSAPGHPTAKTAASQRWSPGAEEVA